MPMTHAEAAKLEHTPDCTFLQGEGYCDCGAIETHFETRAANLERILRKFIQAGVGNSIDLGAHHEVYSETVKALEG